MAQNVLTIAAGGILTEAANAAWFSGTALTAASVTTSGALSSVFLDNYIYRVTNSSSFGFYGGGDATSSVFAYGLSHATLPSAVVISNNSVATLTLKKDNTAIFSSSVTSTTHKVTSAGGYISSDNSTGITTTVTTASLVGKTLTIKDGIITGFA